MDENSFSNTSPWDGLLKSYKRLEERSAYKTVYSTEETRNTFNDVHTMHAWNGRKCSVQEKPPTMASNRVYVNPNYARHNPVIHINPVYVNSRLMQNIAGNQNQEQLHSVTQTNQTIPNSNIQRQCLAHNKSKSDNFNSRTAEENTEFMKMNTRNQGRVISCAISKIDDESNNVNDKSSDKTVTKETIAEKSTDLENSNLGENSLKLNNSTIQRDSSTSYLIKSKTKLVKNSPSKNLNSSLLVLSRRKLIRLKKNKNSPMSSTPSSFSNLSSPLEKNNLPTQENVDTSSKNVSLQNQSIEISKSDPSESSKGCKITESNKTNEIPCKSTVGMKNEVGSRKVQMASTNLVSIGGIFYKKSRNQLIRSDPSILKRKQNSEESEQEQYYIAEDGKKLLKIDTSKEQTGTSPIKVKQNPLTSPTKNHKTDVSYKAKQRSLQILRRKMRKNNQPCLLFQRYGFCANQQNGVCPKVHDKKQVALCKNFLQGKCLLDDCPLSHDIGPEKMPTCKYFLEGCCARDGCPYLHVKVSSKNPICIEFLRGYCPLGNECLKRHIYMCPEFDKSGKCSVGKFCPYPHKSKFAMTKKMKSSIRRKSGVKSTDCLKVKKVQLLTPEPRKRYYDETCEDLSQKRQKLLKYVNIMKEVHEGQLNNSNDKSCSVKHDVKDSPDCPNSPETCSKLKRPPIGPLPSYIPIE